MEEDKKNRDWVAKYIEYMRKENLNACKELVQKHFPESLFKYKTLSDETLDSLENKYIWFSKITSFNDPFECFLQIDNQAFLRRFFSESTFPKKMKELCNIEFSEKEIDQLIISERPFLVFEKIIKANGGGLAINEGGLIKQSELRWLKSLEEMNETIKVSCFSERNDSLLMWSHYADAHKGICIEYSFEKDNVITPLLNPVLYSDNSHKTDDFTIYNYVASAITKYKDWGYESEWRLILGKPSEFFPNKIEVSKPKAIYLGTRFHLNKDEEIKQLKQLAEKQNIPLFQMEKHSTEYKLVKI